MPPKLRTSLAAALVAASAGAFAANAHAHSGASHVEIVVEGDKRCIIANGLPDHATGGFPNRGNPNRISEQNYHLCVDAFPKKGTVAKRAEPGAIGVAVNGVLIRPGTAETWDPNSPRSFSRNGDRNWRLEGLGNAELLGMDMNHAHVDANGIYHYHGTPTGLLDHIDGTLIGYAADGFEIHYVGADAVSSYQLKPGTRPGGNAGPGGVYDGTYVQDWQYVAGSGTLDECNGGEIDGHFAYFVTDSFPFYPRCLWGDISPDFRHGHA